MKSCTKCGETKEPEDFAVDRSSADGRTSSCRGCRRTQARAHYAKSVATEGGLAEAAARRRELRRADPEKAAVSRRRYEEANREQIRERDKAYREANAERIRARKAAYSAAHAAELAAKTRRWQRSNPEKVAIIRERRRFAKFQTATGPIDLQALWTGACGICLGELDQTLRYPHRESPSIDHVVPLARGGTHTQDNLQWAHLACNWSKGARRIA